MEGKKRSLGTIPTYFIDLTKHSTHITYTYFVREDNQFADALAKLIPMINPWGGPFNADNNGKEE